jgi:hypothetical protein
MEADWEMEIGGEAEVIDAAWPGFVDLRLWPERVAELSEVTAFPALGHVLQNLNRAPSAVWTAKCDFWPALEPGTWDADELDASPKVAHHAAGCYIDLLPRSPQQWAETEVMERDCRALCTLLKTVPLPGCRADLIVRRAWITPEQSTNGITAYLTACGSTETTATVRLAACLNAFLHVVLDTSRGIPQIPDSTIQ